MTTLPTEEDVKKATFQLSGLVQQAQMALLGFCFKFVGRLFYLMLQIWLMLSFVDRFCPGS